MSPSRCSRKLLDLLHTPTQQLSGQARGPSWLQGLFKDSLLLCLSPLAVGPLGLFAASHPGLSSPLFAGCLWHITDKHLHTNELAKTDFAFLNNSALWFQWPQSFFVFNLMNYDLMGLSNDCSLPFLVPFLWECVCLGVNGYIFNVCEYMCMYIYIYEYVCLQGCMFVSVYMCECVYVCVLVGIYAMRVSWCTCNVCEFIYMYVCKCIYLCQCVYMY